MKIYDAIPDIIRDVNSGRLKAGFADAPILAYYVKQGMFPGVRLVESLKPSVVAAVGISVRKADTALLAKIDAALAKLKADGTLEKILTKWGLPPLRRPVLSFMREFLADAQDYLPILFQGVQLTVLITLASLVVSTLLGLFWAVLRVSGIAVLAVSAR